MPCCGPKNTFNSHLGDSKKSEEACSRFLLTDAGCTSSPTFAPSSACGHFFSNISSPVRVTISSPQYFPCLFQQFMGRHRLEQQLRHLIHEPFFPEDIIHIDI